MILADRAMMAKLIATRLATVSGLPVYWARQKVPDSVNACAIVASLTFRRRPRTDVNEPDSGTVRVEVHAVVRPLAGAGANGEPNGLVDQTIAQRIVAALHEGAGGAIADAPTGHTIHFEDVDESIPPEHDGEEPAIEIVPLVFEGQFQRSSGSSALNFFDP